MGCFSWLKADELTKVANIVEGAPFKCLIPKEFGGGFIKDNYQGYGYLGEKEDGSPKYDMFELLAFWNKDLIVPTRSNRKIETLRNRKLEELLKYDGEFPMLKEIDQYTDKNRSWGIEIGCYNKQIDILPFPLKLVSASFTGTYEDLYKPSYNDPNQGWTPLQRD